MRVAVVTFPGSNCDYDMYKAARDVMGAEVEYLWHRKEEVGDVDAVFLPGGFSYGDYLRAGAIAHLSPIMESVRAFAEAGGPVLGVCNGFQVLCESRLLPGGFLRNRSLRFRSTDVRLRVDHAGTIFTSDYGASQLLTIPIAHAEGNYHADEETLSRLEGDGRIVFRYVDAGGRPTDEANPNGSAHNIAGIVNEEGNVLGMMPHPERAVDPVLGSVDGRGVFTSLLRHLSRATAA